MVKKNTNEDSKKLRRSAATGIIGGYASVIGATAVNKRLLSPGSILGKALTPDRRPAPGSSRSMSDLTRKLKKELNTNPVVLRNARKSMHIHHSMLGNSAPPNMPGVTSAAGISKRPRFRKSPSRKLFPNLKLRTPLVGSAFGPTARKRGGGSRVR